MAFGHDFKLVFFAWNATIVCIKNTENEYCIYCRSFFLSLLDEQRIGNWGWGIEWRQTLLSLGYKIPAKFNFYRCYSHIAITLPINIQMKKSKSQIAL